MLDYQLKANPVSHECSRHVPNANCVMGCASLRWFCGTQNHRKAHRGTQRKNGLPAARSAAAQNSLICTYQDPSQRLHPGSQRNAWMLQRQPIAQRDACRAKAALLTQRATSPARSETSVMRSCCLADAATLDQNCANQCGPHCSDKRHGSATISSTCSQ